MHRAAIGSIVCAARDAALRAPDRLSPAAFLLLIREYVRTGDAGIAEALGPALGARLALGDTEGNDRARGAWLDVFVEAAACTDDERVRAAADSLAHTIVGGWPARYALERAMVEIRGCVAAAGLVTGESHLLREAIDELERIVGVSYVPGDGLVRTLTGSGYCSMGDHLQSAESLLVAYAATARVPYAMLAEELMHVVRHRWWDEAAGLYVEAGGEPFPENCAAAAVLCRLAALRGNVEYRSATPAAPGADYAGDAGRVLRALSASAAAAPADAAAFALAAAAWPGNEC